MIRVLFFIWRYQILKDPANLAKQTEKFMKLSKNAQKSVLDKYFDKFRNVRHLDSYFISHDSRFYDEGREITFLHSYYFDKKFVMHDVHYISYIDDFMIDKEKKDYLIEFVLENVKGKEIDVDRLVHYPDDLPKGLSSHLDFMTYLVKLDDGNIKYITYRDAIVTRQRELIRTGIESARKKEFSFKRFLKTDGSLPYVLSSNFDFFLYAIENDIHLIRYFDERLVENSTITNRKLIVDVIISSLKKNPSYMEELQKNLAYADILNEDEDFISYMVTHDIEAIRFIHWHHLNDAKRGRIIHSITKHIEDNHIDFNIMKYSFHQLFFENYYFMKYLINKDFRWIAVCKVSDKEQFRHLVEIFFQKIEEKKYRFHLEDFLEDGESFNHLLIDDSKMLHYFFQNKVPVVQYIDFFNLSSSKDVVEGILKEIENKEFEFHNEDFLVNGKYPIPLSNSYRFMRYVIDKNFNHLSYIDISMIDKGELKRIINYAFKMVYYIRGNNKNLSFDIDGYFKDTDIFRDEYFQECLKSL